MADTNPHDGVQCNGVSQNMRILDLLDNSKRVLVIGDIVLDKYIYGTCTRIATECPMPIFAETSQEYRLGGAGNVVNNLHAMGMVVDLLTVVGDHADNIKQLMSNINVSLDGLIKLDNYQVKTNTRYFANGYQCFRADHNSHGEISDNVKGQVAEKAESFLGTERYEVVIISDYRNGLFNTELAQKLITVANKYNVVTLVDPKRGDYERFQGATYIKPNEEDARMFSRSFTDRENVKEVCQTFCEKLKINSCTMTLAQRGIAVYEQADKTFTMIPAQLSPELIVDVCGAGDTAIAAIALGLAHGQTLVDICHFANQCAANVIQRRGTVVVNMIDVIADRVLYTEKEVINLKRIIPKDKVVVLTTGCFDLVHGGHVTFLKQSKDLGDYLIVALNSDVSVKKLKGDSRPVTSLQHRCIMMEATKYVDFIVVFDEKRPDWVVELVDPDIFVKGADYTEERIRSAFPTIRKYVSISSVFTTSTTEMIKAMKET